MTGKLSPRRRLWVCLALLAPVVATAEDYDRDAAFEVSQGAIGNAVGEIGFIDAGGQPVDIAAFRGRPLVVSMIYTSCHHICPTLTRTLAENVAIAREALGDDAFTVVSVGFDWGNDTPDRMLAFARQQGVDDPRWHFLSGGQQAIADLSERLGFQFWPSAKGFDHLLQTTIVDADGRVYRQVYGSGVPAQHVVEPLKELVFDSPREASFVRHWVDRFRLFCTVFDPNSGRYEFDYSIAMTILTGILSLGAIGFFLVHEWRRG